MRKARHASVLRFPLCRLRLVANAVSDSVEAGLSSTAAMEMNAGTVHPYSA
ncbi:hypothetical protein G8E10_05095 [Rhizobiaceae bacterium CRRU44]|uniref:Uncharacterized protein n=1 Tax=Ferranicluibacter rubi TaxID=2715133 RepID=A0AA43ZDG3_9HYPH|nr:hypothetical protein [Ferranicluibacter rubi]NHT75131.1 hypothetical protein [Ferranicluibacter rubi]